MKLKALCLLALSWVSLSAFYWPFDPVPLHIFSEDPIDHNYKLKPRYTVSTLFLTPEADASVDVAIQAWNQAAGSNSFITRMDNTQEANIYVASTFEVAPAGMARAYNPKVCVVTVSVLYDEVAEVFSHEFGHCLGFAHNEDDPEALMQPHKMQGSPEVDFKTQQTLRHLLGV